ncbi:DUF4491 family protein [Bifidobacterium choloepi]|uniref:Membrane associated protein n=1 Tax=Bifidobacterium choloepi TaxID=2614131 RepID=A0A6I5NIE2_9BIFI|nr:DUF4491 family protein [Bifidobacterium choloepi]NEG70133.1 hypothetical protein [Bifidobacterium choloepi]
MTDHKNSNDGDDRSADFRKGERQAGSDVASAGANTEESWADFMAEHAGDLDDVENSRAARKFNRKAECEEKKALLDVEDLKKNAFVGGNRFTQPGPRDHAGTSWLDTDDVMDRYGEDFTPPNPSIGHVSPGRVVLWILFVAGILGIIASTLVPSLASVLGVIFGLCLIVGAGGLFATHRGHDDTKRDEDDDGARV